MNCPHCTTLIEEHPAGPCLDRWIKLILYGPTPDDHYDQITHYSTDISAAWELIAGEPVTLDSDGRGCGWEIACYFSNGDGTDFHAFAKAPTASLAICRAYILSKGE